ncbi:MAG: haloacid dehalogenase-like hydrolase, partial [Candidatus Diapherotrites archaeon]|nr:haloacid dehalogenase-like hydrolase [Candidatus Diapherotrites archaeon]
AYDLSKRLNEKGLFGKSAWEKMQLAVAEYRKGKIDYSLLASKVFEAYAQGIKGQRVLRVIAEAQGLVSNSKSKILKNAKQLIEAKKRAGKTFAVSLSPIECISFLKKQLGFSYVYGLRFCSRNGIYTGKYNPDLDKFKQNAVKTIVKMFKLDPKRTTYFGDSISDLAFTKRVRLKHKTGERKALRFRALNPNAELRETLAKKRIIGRR